MKITKENLERRVDQDLIISDDTYSKCILDMIHLLYIELSKLLVEEGRMFGIMLKYMDIVQNCFDSVDSAVEDESDYDLYGKCMYLYKPMLYQIFKKLRRKRLSKADCIIVISKALLEYLRSTGEDIPRKEVKSIYKVTMKMYDNIQNSKKASSISLLIETISYFRNLGQVGLYPLDQFSISQEEKRREKTILEGSGIRIDSSEVQKVTEISWIDE